MAEADGGATSSDFSYHEGQKREDVCELTALLVVYDYAAGMSLSFESWWPIRASDWQM